MGSVQFVYMYEKESGFINIYISAGFAFLAKYSHVDASVRLMDNFGTWAPLDVTTDCFLIAC